MTRLLICDDHAVVRAGLRILLERQPEISFVAEAGSAEEALALVGEVAPDIVLLDLSMPGMGGLAAIPLLKQVAPDIKVLVLTVHEDEAFFSTALRAGATGYLLKGVAAGELIAALRLVALGGVPVPPILAQRVAAGYLGAGKASDDLSEREIEILKLVAAGRSNKEIADVMALSLRSVERHRGQIMSKLGLQSRAELMRYAINREPPDPNSGRR